MVKVSKFQNEFMKSLLLPKYEPRGKNSMVKVSKFQNEFMKSLFLQKYEPEILTIFGSFINSF